VIRCSFCGINDEEVGCMVAGPSVQICSNCIGLVVGIVAAEHPAALKDLKKEIKTGYKAYKKKG
jgi:ATP-dependent protease Clp ATPase subunit